MKPISWLLVGGGALALAAFVRRGAAISSGAFLFPYRDNQYLGSGQKLGGLAYVPPGTSSGAPLLVYLHGNNDGGAMHTGLGAVGDGYDLRQIVPRGMVVAAPSQTVAASGAGLWANFDLEKFVDAVEAAIGGRIDRRRVILAGHSGAGCAVGSGLLRPLGALRPARIVAIDVCAGPGFGEAFGKLGEEVPVQIFYQTRSWPRDFAGMRQALRGRASLEEISVTGAANPHAAIVPLALERVLS